MTDTDHLRELDKAATPVPWTTEMWMEGTYLRHGAVLVGDATWRADAALIAETRNALPALLDELDALRAVAEAARLMREDPCAAVNYGCDSVAAFDYALRRLDQQGGEK